MGTRIKTFDSTGTAPNGRLYAGDLNAMEDQYADQTNLAQTISLGTLAIGEVGLQLLRYGASEARISGALRTDGIIRALGGFIAGAFTTTARNAISLPPYGMVILNTTTNQLEMNYGTAGSPVWASVGAEPPGVVDMYVGGSAPAGWLLCDGVAYSRTTYANLFTVIGTQFGVGDGSTTFNVPDFRGRVPVGVGTHVDVNLVGKNEGRTLANRRVMHTHDVVIPSSGAGPGSSGTLAGSGTIISTVDGAAYEALNFIIKT